MKKHCFLPLFLGTSQKMLKKRWFCSFSANFVQSVLKNVKEHCFLESCRKSTKNADFSPFLRTLYKVSQKTWKNTVFSHFLHNVAQKTLIFRILCELCTKCLEKHEKTLFSHTFGGTSRKKFKKRCFSKFSANFVQSVSKNVKKHCFLTLFGERPRKNSKNAHFSNFLRTMYKLSWKTWKNTHTFCKTSRKKNAFFCKLCTKCLKKREKNTVFSHFSRNDAEKAQKTLFFNIFCELCIKCFEKREKNTVFSHFFRNIEQKAQKTMFFAFFQTFFKVSRKTWKNTVSSHFFGNVAEKAQKTLILLIFCELCTKCLEKRERKLFSHTFCITSRKKRWFFSFSANFVQSVSKNVKNTVSSQFLGNVAEKPQKTFFFFYFSANFVQSVSKNVKEHSHFLHNVAQKKKTLFLRTLTKCPKRREKNTFFSHFLRNVAQKKPKKRCFFRISC